MKMVDMDRMIINNAIREVLTTQFKKDCPEAHKAVESCGYYAYKEDGLWHVKSKKTGRNVWITNSGRIEHDPYGGSRATDLDKFDFVGCLEKPYNTEYWDSLEYNVSTTYVSKAVQNWRYLKSLQYQANCSSKRLDRLTKKIEELQGELVSAAKQETIDWGFYSEFRKGLGLGREK